jgi:hypothetical protein
MKISELFEAKPAKKTAAKAPPPRNFVAKNAQTSGAGQHNGGKKKIAAKDEKKLADE